MGICLFDKEVPRPMIFRNNNIGVVQRLMKLQPRCGAYIHSLYGREESIPTDIYCYLMGANNLVVAIT